MSDPKTTPEPTPEEIQARRAEEAQARREARKAEAAKAREVQHAIDLEALDCLEIEHGENRVASFELGYFEPGLPTLAVVRMPQPVEYKRFLDMAAKKVDGAAGNAARLMCLACLVYPDRPTYEKLVAQVPGVVDQLSMLALHLAEGKAVERGKS